MWRRTSTVLAIVLLVALTGCSAGDDNSASPGDTVQPATGDDSGSDGDAPESAGGGDTSPTQSDGSPAGAGEDFPIAIPNGWEIDIHAEIGLTGSGGVQLLYPDDEFDTLVAFYDQWTSDQTDEYAKSEADDLILFTRMDSPAYTIAVTGNHEERGDRFTLLQLSVGNEG